MKVDARTMNTHLLNPESNCDQNHISVVRRYLDRHHLLFSNSNFLLKIHCIKLFNFVLFKILSFQKR